MFSYRKPSDRAIACVSDGRILYLHDIDDLPAKSGNQAVDDKNFRDLFETDEFESDSDLRYELLPEMRPKQTDRIIISSSSGAGKSTLIANYIERFFEAFPNANNVILFTNQDDEDSDPAFEGIKDRINHIKINESILEDPIELHELCAKDEDGNFIPRIILFDDYTDGVNKKVDQAMERLRDAISSNGRKLNLYLISIQTKLPLKSESFRQLISNCTHFIVFPSKAPSNLRYALESYFDIKDTIWSKVKKQFGNSRWTMFTKNEQPLIIGQRMCLILDMDRIEDAIKISDRLDRKIAAEKASELFKQYTAPPPKVMRASRQ